MDINQQLAEAIKQNRIIKFVDTVSGSLNTSVLQVEKEAQFVQELQAATVMLDGSRYIGMKSDKKDIDRINFELDLEDGSRNASTGLITLTGQDPTFTLNELDAQKLMAKTQMTYEALEDNIEQGSLESTIISLFAKAAGRSLERIFIFGDQSLSAGANVPSGYTKIDGWAHEADSDQILTSGDFTATDVETVFETMYDALDPQYLSQAVFYVPYSRESEYRRALKGRDTAMGDEAVAGASTLYFEGVPIKPVASLDYPVNNATFAANISKEVLFLGAPNNFVHGLKRGITVETDKDIEHQMYKFILSLRGDCEYEDETKVVVGKPDTT
jgi:HK97 family phage major capsid protein